MRATRRSRGSRGRRSPRSRWFNLRSRQYQHCLPALGSFGPQEDVGNSQARLRRNSLPRYCRGSSQIDLVPTLSRSRICSKGARGHHRPKPGFRECPACCPAILDGSFSVDDRAHCLAFQSSRPRPDAHRH